MQKVNDRCWEVLKLANSMYGTDFNSGNTEIVWNLRSGRVAGQAGARGLRDAPRSEWKYRIRLNRVLVASDPEYFLNVTIPHEVAHLVTYRLPHLGHAHNSGWKRICKALGGTGEIYVASEKVHEALKTQGPRKARYKLCSGTVVDLSMVRHNRTQRREMQYRWLKTGETIRPEHFVELVRTRG